LKVVAKTGGFNINYMDIQPGEPSLNTTINKEMRIYPNPVHDEIIIRTDDFQFNKIEIINMTGAVVFTKTMSAKTEVHLPLNLMNGSYIVKVSNENQYITQNIVVNNNY
jgi:hypothetical protein